MPGLPPSSARRTRSLSVAALLLVLVSVCAGCDDLAELLRPARQVEIVNASLEGAQVTWEAVDHTGFGSAGIQLVPACGRLDLPLQPGEYEMSVRSVGGPIRFTLPVPDDPGEPVSTIAVRHDGWVLVTLADFLMPKTCGEPGVSA